jgi:gas vesicle protein
MLKDAVQAVYNKVQTDLTNASPEELAYLSTSLEKLGGRATVYDVMDVGEDKKTEMQELADSLVSDLSADIAGKEAQFETDIQAIVDLQTTNFNTLVSDSTVEINTVITNAENSLNQTISDIQADVTQAESDIADASAALTDSAAVANQQAINGSAFNLYLYGTLQS